MMREKDSGSSLMPDCAPAVQAILKRFPGTMAIYAFGSRVEGTGTAESDFDLAVLVGGYIDPVERFEFSGELEDLYGFPVDLVDFRAATTVMQAEILNHGIRCWSNGLEAELFELYVLKEKMWLDELRSDMLHEIAERGSVYGE